MYSCWFYVQSSVVKLKTQSVILFGHIPLMYSYIWKSQTLSTWSHILSQSHVWQHIMTYVTNILKMDYFETYLIYSLEVVSLKRSLHPSSPSSYHILLQPFQILPFQEINHHLSPSNIKLILKKWKVGSYNFDSWEYWAYL